MPSSAARPTKDQLVLVMDAIERSRGFFARFAGCSWAFEPEGADSRLRLAQPIADTCADRWFSTEIQALQIGQRVSMMVL